MYYCRINEFSSRILMLKKCAEREAGLGSMYNYIILNDAPQTNKRDFPSVRRFWFYGMETKREEI